jgi:hypothetical protein
MKGKATTYQSIYLHRQLLGHEDPVIPAPRVPCADSPPSRIGQLSKACSTSSAIIGKLKGLSLPMDTIP